MMRTLSAGIFAVLTLCLFGAGCSSDKSNDPQDGTPPGVYMLEPDEQDYYSHAYDTLIPLDGPLWVTFSEPVNPATINASTFWVEGKPGTVTFGRDTTYGVHDTAYFWPATPFAHDAMATAHLSGAIQDLAGNRLQEGNFSWTFATRGWRFIEQVRHAMAAPGTGEGAAALAVIRAADGNFVLAGLTGGDLSLIKLDPAGQWYWRRSYDFGEADRGEGVVQTGDGGFAVAGYFGAVSNIGLLLKTDAQGNEVWRLTLPDVRLDGITLAPDGDLIVYGYSPAGTGAYAARYAPNGTLRWARSPVGTIVGGLCPAPGGGYLYATNWQRGPTDSRHWLGIGKLGESGTTLWTKVVKGGPTWLAQGLTPLDGGDYLLFGESWGTTIGDQGGAAVVVDDTGAVVWEHVLRSIGGESPAIVFGAPYRGEYLLTQSGSGTPQGGSLWRVDLGGGVHRGWMANSIEQALYFYGGLLHGDDVVLVGQNRPATANPPLAVFLRLRFM